MVQSRKPASPTPTQPSKRQTESLDEGLQELSQQGVEAVSQAQEQAVKLVGMAREQATTQVATQKERAAIVFTAVGSALHEVSREVRGQDEPAIADFIDGAAVEVDRLATMVKNQDMGQLLESTGQFARKQPILFLAAAVATGYVVTRFMKSSSSANGASPQDSLAQTARDTMDNLGASLSEFGSELANAGKSENPSTSRDSQAERPERQ